MKKIKIVIAIAFCLLFIGTYIVPAEAGVRFHLRRYPKIKVMTYNVYVGGDVLGILNSLPTDPSIPLPPEVIIDLIATAVASLFQEVIDTNFPERAEAIAHQIKRFRPHLVGLQEVSLINIQRPSDFLIGNPELAEEEFFNYKELLLDELGGQYVEVIEVQNADIELPMLGSVVGESGLVDARLIQRDVILARRDVLTSNSISHNYAAAIPLPNPLGNGFIGVIKRGFVATDATIRRKTYRFVNTHLEVQDFETLDPYPPFEPVLVQELQARELIALLDGNDDEILPIILVGDFNSEPDPTVVEMLAANHYMDLWPIRWFGRKLLKDGDTCCQDFDLLNTDSALSERIDHIFIKNIVDDFPFTIVLSLFARVLGNKPKDKTPSGLWPSDHGGVFGKMIIPSFDH